MFSEVCSVTLSYKPPVDSRSIFGCFQKFLSLVKEWPSNLYNVQTIITATLDRLDRERNNTVLLRALGEL